MRDLRLFCLPSRGMKEASGRPAKSAGKTRATDARPLKDIYEMAWVFYFLGSAAKDGGVTLAQYARKGPGAYRCLSGGTIAWRALSMAEREQTKQGMTSGISLVRRWAEYLVAILIGNIVYLFVEPQLPEGMRHRLFRVDPGLAIDFLLCVGVYGLVLLVRRQGDAQE